MSDDAPPIACNPSGIDEDEHDAHREAAEAVFTAIEAVNEVPRGYSFRLPPSPSVLGAAGTFVARERLCCPFFQFTLEASPNNGPVQLTLTGREGVKEYIETSVLPHWNLDATG